jgi:hypothetical protein
MAALAETDSWEAGIYQIELTDPVVGGPDGISNRQAKQLANRTLWLKGLLEALQLDLTEYAPLASPAFTGTPSAPTPAAGDNSQRLANTAFVQAALAAVVNSSPAALDTLNELAAALGNDPNFATTITNALAGKENALGFTPVQQGGGVGMMGNKVLLGFDGNGNLIFQVDATAFGRLWSENNQLALGTTASSARAALQLGDAATLNGTSTLVGGAVVVRDGNGDVAVRNLYGYLAGVAEKAAKLETARTINGVAFDGTANITIADPTKAPLNSPALIGTPTAPTAAAGTNTTQLANTAFVQAALAALVNSSPAALDTLNELAAALGNDPNFATTIANALAGKVNRDWITDAGFMADNVDLPYFKRTSDGAFYYLQRALGFTPVRQGSGAYQLTNNVHLGWDGSALRYQIDATDFGPLWGDSNGVQKVAAAIAAMAVGYVASYALCVVGGGSAGVAVPAGTLVAGSNLRYAAASGAYSGTPDGTWRVMGHLADANLDDTNSTTLCLRVS